MECGKPCPSLTHRAAEAFGFVVSHALRRPRVAPMGEVLGFALSEVEIAARCVGYEIGADELRLIEVLEEEWKEALEARRKRTSEAGGQEVEEDGWDDEDDAE